MTIESDLPERIRTIRELRGMTNDDLAEAMEVDPSAVSRMQSGKRGLSSKSLAKFSMALGIDLSDLMNPGMTPQDVIEAAEVRGRTPAAAPKPKPKPNISPPEPLGRPSRSRIPVYGQAVGGPAGDGRFLMNGTVLDYIPTPPELENVRDGYAVRVYGTSMEPRLYAGNTLNVDPNLPVRIGDNVIVQVAGDDGEVHGYVKELVGMGREIVLRQLNPPDGEDEIIRFPAKNVLLHRVVSIKLS